VTTSNRESAAYNILTLLATELPKLAHISQTQKSMSPVYSEQSNKRKRLNEEEVSGSTSHDSDDAPPLPEPQFMNSITAAYFSHVHPWIPMIHQATFIQRLSDDTERNQLTVVLHAMVISASKFVPDSWTSTRTYSRARNWVICTAMDHLSLEGLQALIILAFDDIGNGSIAKAWSIIGSLTRTVEYMQLTRETEDGEHRSLCQPYVTLPWTDDWTKIEERRRVFWVVFMLDRFCSVTMGWSTALTSEDIYRRLPCDGHLWRKQTPVVTPYLGIWDKSKRHIGTPIGCVPHFPSPLQGANNFEEQIYNAPSIGVTSSLINDLSTIGALAYNIEAIESMNRVMSHFLQQKVNVRDESEISSWLTRFKELDLRLVHWKMLLPQRWKANPNLTRHVPLMDPNLTTAHVTHNASMILLHQPIAYPPLHWGFRNRLPSGCSAEACYSAGVEIATITERYLVKSPAGSPIGGQYAFCVFVAARVLLSHWRYTPRNQLPPEFWSLVQSLDVMSHRWHTFSEVLSGGQDLFAKYATRLKEIYELCATNESYQVNVMDYTNDISHQEIAGPSQPYHRWPDITQIMPQPDVSLQLPHADFNTIPMLDLNFTDMDRVISFDDGSMFTAAFEAGPSTW
jgi:hypothetical protein